MTTIISIYGASDDLIECEGDIVEEWNTYEGHNWIAVSDGTLLSVKYDADGFWRINVLHHGSATAEKSDATSVDDDYSDIVTLTGDIEWVAWLSTGPAVRKT